MLEITGPQQFQAFQGEFKSRCGSWAASGNSWRGATSSYEVPGSIAENQDRSEKASDSVK
jgi:hypothetical protein